MANGGKGEGAEGIISQKCQRQGDGFADRTRAQPFVRFIFSEAGVIISQALKPRFPAARVFALLRDECV